MSGAADTGPAPRLLLQLAVIRSMVSAELASTAIRVQDATSGGAHGTHQV